MHRRASKAFRILEEKTTAADACRRSTSLYPGTLVAAAKNANPDIVKDVTVALLTMPAKGGYDWVANADLSSVRELMRALALGPYAYLRDWSPAGIWRRFSLEISLFAALVLAVFVHIARTNLLVRRRTEALREEARKLLGPDYFYPAVSKSVQAARLRACHVFYNQVCRFLRAPLISRRAGERAEFGFFYRRGQCDPRRVFLREAQHYAHGGGRGGGEAD